MDTDTIDNDKNTNFRPTAEIIESSSSDERQADTEEVEKRARRQSADEQEDGQESTIQTSQEIQDKAKKDEALRQEAEIERKKRYGIKEIEWNEELDARLYSTASQVYETLLQMQKDTKTVGLIRQNQLMFLNMMEKAQERFKNGKQAFETREQIIEALGAIVIDEMLVCDGKGIKIVLEDQAEEETSDKKPKTRGLGAATRIFGAFRSVGSPTGLPDRFLDGVLRTFYKPEIIPEEEENIGINIEEQAEKIIHPYYRKVGESRWEKEDDQEVIDYIEKTTRTRMDIVKALGLNPTIDFNLDALLLRVAGQTHSENIRQQDRIFKELLEGRQISDLKNTEISEFQMEVVDRSVVEYCEDQATKLLTNEAVSGQQYEKEILQIEEKAAAMESGEAKRENVEKEITTLQKEVQELKQEIGLMASSLGLPAQETEEAEVLQETSSYLQAQEEFESARNTYYAVRDGEKRIEKALDNNRAKIKEFEDINTELVNLKRGSLTVEGLEREIQQLEGQISGIQEGEVEQAGNARVNEQIRLKRKVKQLIESGGDKKFGDLIDHNTQQINRLKEENGSLGSSLEDIKTKKEDNSQKEKHFRNIFKLFDQTLGKYSQIDALRSLQAKRSKLTEKEEGMQGLENRKAGKVEQADREEAAKTRMISQLNQSQMFNQLLVAVDAKTIITMGNTKDQDVTQVAIEDATFDNIKITVKNEDGTETERPLTDEEKKELFTRAEILQVGMESFGVDVEEMISGQPLDSFNRLSSEVKNHREEINELRESRTAINWEQEVGRIEAEINRKQEEMQELLADLGFLDILPYLSRDVFATRQFVSNSLEYLRAKAARGELYMAPRVVRETKSKEAEYQVQPTLNTDFGQLEIIPQKDWWASEKGEKVARHLTLKHDFTTENGIKTRINLDFRRYLPENIIGERRARDVGLGLEHQIEFQVAVKRDEALWKSLPDDIKGYKKGTPLKGWPEGLPQDVIMVAYRKNKRINVSELCDGSWLNYYSQPKEESTVNKAMRKLLESQIPGRNLREANEFLMASLTKRFLKMDEKEKEKLFNGFRPIPFNRMDREFIISSENGQIYVADEAGQKQRIEDFTREENFVSLYKTWKGVSEDMSDNQRKECQRVFEGMYARIGLALLKSMERKTLGR